MRTSSIASLLCAASCLGLVGSCFAQATPAFSDEPYVITKALTNVSMNADATGTRTITFAVRIQSQAALQQFSVTSISYASKAEKADFVYVRATHSDGTTQDSDITQTLEQAAPVTQQAPFYSDLEIKQLPVKSLRVGDTLEWQARFVVDHPEVPGQIWGKDNFIQGAVSLDETYELRVPSTLHLTAWTNPRFKDAFSESTDAGTHIYRWHHTDLKPTVGTEADAFRKAEETRRRTPDEELDLTKGVLPSLAWTSFADWAAVGAWYKTLAADRTTPDPAIRAKVAELTAGKTTDLEKAQAVYNYVATRIRYIGVAFGIGRYQPHTAAEILANQYGDCKDKHTLLASMLSVLNLQAEPVLIGEGIRFNAAVPSPASFNHLITRLKLNGSDVWLDTTAEVGPWGALIQPIRDHDALVIPAASPAVIVRSPADLPYPAVTTATVVGTLDKDLTSESKFVFTLRGDDEIAVRAVLRNVSPSNYGQFVQQFMAGMGFGGTTSDPSFEHIDDTTQPLQMSFHYRRLKEKDWGDNRVTAAFMGINLPSFTEDRPAISSIQLGIPRTEDSTIEMKLPAGWNAQLPEAVHAHAAFATCDVTYRVENETLYAERRLVILQSKVPVEDFKKYQSWYDESGASGYPYVQLVPPIKVGNAATAPQPDAPEAPANLANNHPSDPKAADLVQKAFDSLRSMDLDGARKSVDQAREINPTEKGLWAVYATISQMLGKTTEVIANLQHEVSYHPEETQIYEPLVQMQIHTGDTSGALATLRGWVKTAPDTPDASLALAAQLESMKRHPEALKEAQDAIARLEPLKANVRGLRIVAADAQVALGHAKEAADAVAPMLADATNPLEINNIAYILAEAGTSLQQAADAQTKVLSQRDSESADWTLNDNLRPLLQKESTMAGDWDTMAWILYRQGKFSEAFAYIEPAMHASGRQEIRDHLAAIVAALHNTVKLHGFPLGSSNGHHGVASLNLLIADGKIIDSSPQDLSSSTPTLDNYQSLIKDIDFRPLFPPNSKARLIRSAFVNCHQSVCELILAPLP